MTPQRLHRDSTRGAGPEKRLDLLVVARPEMCEAGREEPALSVEETCDDGLDSHLMSAHRGNPVRRSAGTGI